MSPYIWFLIGLVATPIFGILIHIWFGNWVITTLAVIVYLVGTFWNLRTDRRKKKEGKGKDRRGDEKRLEQEQLRLREAQRTAAGEAMLGEPANRDAIAYAERSKAESPD